MLGRLEWRSGDLPDTTKYRRTLLTLFTLILYCVFLSGYYGLVSTAIHFYPRYLSPYAFPGIAAIAATLGLLVARWKAATYLAGVLLAL
jgi:hypothetical protein